MNQYRRKSDSLTFRLLSYTVCMFLAYLVYEGHSPVVKNFEIEHGILTEDYFQFYGTFQKLRNCKFDSINVTTPRDDKDHRLMFEFTDVRNVPVENLATRQKGLQYYGPWTVFLDPKVETIDIRTLHQCNFGIFVSTQIIRDFPLQDF